VPESDRHLVILRNKEDSEGLVLGSLRGKADSPQLQTYWKDLLDGCRRIGYRGFEEECLVRKFRGDWEDEKRRMDEEIKRMRKDMESMVEERKKVRVVRKLL
jgi:hypothetical protein